MGLVLLAGTFDVLDMIEADQVLVELALSDLSVLLHQVQECVPGFRLEAVSLEVKLRKVMQALEDLRKDYARLVAQFIRREVDMLEG